MTKLQKRAKSQALYLPVALQAGVHPATPPLFSNLPSSYEYPGVKPNSITPLSPFQKTHRRAVSTPRSPQTQWPLIATSTPPSVAYPISPHHDTRTCGANCTRCGKKKLIQLNSPPSANIPNSAAPLRPVPQAHMRAVSEGVVSKSPKRLSITTTPAILTSGKPPCCQKCGRYKRPQSLPLQSSSQHVQVQMPSTHQRRSSKPLNYSVLRTNVSGTNSGTPHPNKLPSRSPSPPSPDRFYPSTPTGDGEHVISPLSPRRKADFAFPSKSSSGASTMPYSPLSQSDETVEIGTGRLINLISSAIRETSPHLSTGAYNTSHARATSLPPPTNGSHPHAYTPLHSYSHSRNTSREAVAGLGLGLPEAADNSISSATTHLTNSRSPIDISTRPPFEPIELDSIPIGDTTADILAGYDDGAAAHREEGSYAEYNYDWTDAISIPVIRLPSVKEGISRFKSLRGGGNPRHGSGGVGRRPSVRERFGSLRGNGNGNGNGTQHQQAGGWYGGLESAGSKYQALGSTVEVGGY